MGRITGSCQCGKSRFHLSRCPTRRLFCHCKICQKAYGQDYADILITHPSTYELEAGHLIEFKSFKKIPPVAKRGICQGCQRPVMSLLTVFPGLTFAVFPSYTIGDGQCDLTPSFHIFYGSRKRDVSDDLPKYDGFLSSFTLTTPAMLMALAGK